MELLTVQHLKTGDRKHYCNGKRINADQLFMLEFWARCDSLHTRIKGDRAYHYKSIRKGV